MAETNNPTFDFDAIIPKFEKRTVKLGGRVFDITEVPLGVGALFTRAKLDFGYTFTDAIQDATIVMLNQRLKQDEYVDRNWLKDNLPGTHFGQFTDSVLAPFYSGQKKAVQETIPEQNHQKKL